MKSGREREREYIFDFQIVCGQDVGGNSLFSSNKTIKYLMGQLSDFHSMFKMCQSLNSFFISSRWNALPLPELVKIEAE